MVDEPREVAHLTLVDLVVARLVRAALHYVYAGDAVRDEPGEFADGVPAVEGLY